MVETKAGRQAVRAAIFIDCSGDGDLAAWAGAPFEIGDGDGGMLYPSMMFRLNGVDPGRGRRGLADHPRTDGARRKPPARISFPRKGAIVRPQRSAIEWRVNVTQLAGARRARHQRHSSRTN